MATRVARCPSCGTAFKVGEDQLRLRGGWVRCGVCRHLFQIGEGQPPTAAQPPVSTPPPAPPSRPAAEPRPVPWPPERQADEPRTAVPPARTPPAPMFADANRSRAPSRAEPRIFPPQGAAPAENARKSGFFADGPEPEDGMPGDDYDYMPQSRGSHEAYRPAGGLSFLRPGSGASAYLRVVWTVGFVIAVLLLLGQALWWWRTPIATYMPASRPLLESACAVMGCTVGYVRNPEKLTIESSSVQPVAVPGEAPGNRLALTALVRNRSGYPQPWPALELSLTDFSDTVVIRRVLQPSEYLTPDRAGQPFAAQSEQNITVEFTAQGVPVSGYRIALFFP